MEPEKLHKQRAIDTHSRQAGEFADSYSTLESDGYGTCFAYSRRRLDESLAHYLPERGDGKRLLDVGCGTGHHMISLAARGFEVTGVDGSEEMLVHARANNPKADIRQSDVDTLPFKDSSFDYVICIEVLRYLPDFSQCVREMARVLKPGGICLTTATPVCNLNGYYLINRVASAVRVSDLVPLKQFFTTSDRLRRGFRKAGFAEVDVRGVYLGPINWVERLTPRILPSVLRSWESIDKRLANRMVLREFANMFLVRGIKKKPAL